MEAFIAYGEHPDFAICAEGEADFVNLQRGWHPDFIKY